MDLNEKMHTAERQMVMKTLHFLIIQASLLSLVMRDIQYTYKVHGSRAIQKDLG